MRPPGKARRGSKPGVCDRRVTQPGEMQRRPNAEVFRDHCTSDVAGGDHSGGDPGADRPGARRGRRRDDRRAPRAGHRRAPARAACAGDRRRGAPADGGAPRRHPLRDDQARCGLVLAGNEPLWARLASGERAAQLVSRIGIRRRLTRPADTDILALAERLLRLRPTGDARRAVLQAGRGIGGLRAVRKLAGQALVSARAEGRDRIAPGDVALAAAMEAALATSCLSPQNQDRRTNDLPRGLLWHFRKCHSSPARPTGLAQATRLTFRRTYPQRSWWCLRRGNRRQGRRNPRGCRGWIE